MLRFTLRLVPVGASDPDVEALLAAHHALMRSQSPEESCHVMTAEALRVDGARVFALWDGPALAAVGALKPLAEDDAPTALRDLGPVLELKSMHVAGALRGRGLGRVLLDQLLTEARATGAAGVCLETGTADSFAAARRLYLGQGFAECPPFGDYRPDPLSVFMCRAL
ncbi:GNAT family N-acetyltransferase [Maliponia aquimaris]|uniref:GNAT family N-acetyltransferase n=1 Tax=Maliponia aquimaris TaxID=1673631 RepID=UPI001FE440DB|nr:GNAT family N-acetyltransferase [Maliponia aquimaris]